MGLRKAPVGTYFNVRKKLIRKSLLTPPASPAPTESSITRSLKVHKTTSHKNEFEASGGSGGWADCFTITWSKEIS